MNIVPANKASWDDLEAVLGGHVGHARIFAAAGFTEVSRPTLRRAVLRIDF